MGVRITLARSVSNNSSSVPEKFASRSQSRNPDVPELFLDREVPRLLGDPRGIEVRGDPHYVHSPDLKLDEEQDEDRLRLIVFDSARASGC
jgi:hypothetical protein